MEIKLTKNRASQRLLEALVPLEAGTIVPYDHLTNIVGADSRTKGRGAVLSASRKLLREHQRFLVNVKNVGYQVSFPSDHAPQAEAYQAQSKRRLTRAIQVLMNVALDQLNPQEQNRVVTELVRARMKVALTTRLDKAKELPPPEQVQIPKGGDLLRLLTKQTA